MLKQPVTSALTSTSTILMYQIKDLYSFVTQLHLMPFFMLQRHPMIFALLRSIHATQMAALALLKHGADEILTRQVTDEKLLT